MMDPGGLNSWKLPSAVTVGFCCLCESRLCGKMNNGFSLESGLSPHTLCRAASRAVQL